jgi:DsbC/DsbD-like thiol-disulfide interchange protein
MTHVTGALFAALLAAPAGGERAVTASLIPEVESIRPGKAFWLGVRLQMAPGWHTYWKNSGDSGLPTRVTWTLPAGFQAGPLQWPYPERLVSGPLMDYGYQGDIALLAEITPGPSVQSGGQAPLALQVKWLECREKCLPGSADLSITLPVRAEPPRMAAPWAALFREARQRLPRASAGWRFEKDKARANILLLKPPVTLGPAHEAYFFSEEPARLEHAAPQRLAGRGAKWWLELEQAANGPKTLEDLHGVVTLKAAGRGKTQALAIEARAVKEEGR